MGIEIRSITPEELAAFTAAQGSAFGFDLNPQSLPARAATFEFERSTAVFDGGEIVGTAGIFSFELTVPGGQVPCAGVTMVSVRPTHRRQGILSTMMSRQLEAVAERGEPVAALWASESGIYGRFGYGLSSQNADLRIDRTRTTMEPGFDGEGRVRMVTEEEAQATWPATYDRVRRSQPGMYSRSEAWWRNRVLFDPEWRRDGYTAQFRVSYEEGGVVRGYAIYRVKQGWENWLPNGTVSVNELISETPEAYRALWRYLFGVDLVARIEARERRIDEPLYWMLSDPRRLERLPHDALWIRIVDVARALSGRRYAVDGRLVLEVHDAMRPGGGGRYVVEGGPSGATCRPTTETAQIELGIRELGTLYMGSHSPVALHQAGRLSAADDRTLGVADAMFRTSPQPWCPEVF